MNRIHAADKFLGSIFDEVYRVGGSVRDEIIGKRPKDADYVVRGVPIQALGRRLTAAGCKIAPLVTRGNAHLGWFASIPDVGRVEIVLPRIEQSAGSGRNMAITVKSDISLVEDAKRRDFTFNALYKGVGPDWPASAVEGGVIDPTGEGLYDLQHRRVQVTHDESFVDDPLRMLRALRFVSTLDAEIAGPTKWLMTRDADKVHGLMSEKRTEKVQKTCKCAPGCAHERTVEKGGGTSGTVFEEFSKLLMGQAPGKALRIARDTGVLAAAMPELAPMLGHEPGSRYHDLNTDEHTFKALDIAAARRRVADCALGAAVPRLRQARR
jgi:tRNA nucleotidyltransferase/poly(A) polymerase